MNSDTLSPLQRALAMGSLILAGETIFVPAFYFGRYFRSSMMELLSLSDQQLGEAYAIYGIVAMISYIFGGPLADQFSPRKLMVGSLLVTGSGCLYMATFPSVGALKVLYAFWGASSVLAFWAPLLKATRAWGGDTSQGSAFGLLDGGRGLVAALIATVAAFYFAWRVDETISDTTQIAAAIRVILYFFFACCCFAAGSVWMFVPKVRVSAEQEIKPSESALSQVIAIAKNPSIWLQALVVVAAYSAFKTFDYYGLYLEDIVGKSKSESAQVIAYLSYLRVVSAILAGWIADKAWSVASIVLAGFLILLVVYLLLLFGSFDRFMFGMTVANMAVSCIAFFALRGIYFAMMEEEGVPKHLTGTAVGVISFIGYTPEIFSPWINGWLLSRAREIGELGLGYDRIFTILLGFTILGILATTTLIVRRRVRSKKLPPDPASIS